MDKPVAQGTLEMRHSTKSNKTKTQYRKLKRWATRTLKKKSTHVLSNGRQLPFLFRYQQYYTYSQTCFSDHLY
jgi:hypothetical protein